MQFCEKHGMVVNEIKTKMMVVNGIKDDGLNFSYRNITVKHTTSYVYLGSPFTENGNVRSILENHTKMKRSDLNKFKIFCKKNETMPYICLLYTSPSPRDVEESRMPSSA